MPAWPILSPSMRWNAKEGHDGDSLAPIQTFAILYATGVGASVLAEELDQWDVASRSFSSRANTATSAPSPIGFCRTGRSCPVVMAEVAVPRAECKRDRPLGQPTCDQGD